MKAAESLGDGGFDRKEEKAAACGEMIHELPGEEVVRFWQRSMPDDEGHVFPGYLRCAGGGQKRGGVFARGIGGGLQRGLQGAGLGGVIADNDGLQHGGFIKDEVEDVVGRGGIGGQLDTAGAAPGGFVDGDGVALQHELGVLHLHFDRGADVIDDKAQRQLQGLVRAGAAGDTEIEEELGLVRRLIADGALNGDGEILCGGLGVGEQVEAQTLQRGEGAAERGPAAAGGIPVALAEIAEHPDIGAAGLIAADVV